MKYGVSSKLGLGLVVALALAGGCAAPEAVSKDEVGTARVRIEASHTYDFELTLVRVATTNGAFQTELLRDGSGAFTGSLQLPPGFHEIIGEAFAGSELVGISAPVPVEIHAGFVTAASIRILDITGGQDIGHSPIVVSLTHPLSTITNLPVQLAVTAVDPDGQGVSAAWSSDCADAQISSPFDAVTSFSKPTPGVCRVSVTVSDGELSNTESFNIVVFDQNQAHGAVDVDGEFLSAPQMFLDLGLPGRFCSVFSNALDGTCPGEIAAPTRAVTSVFVDWGKAEPGFIDVSDNCGGIFEDVIGDQFSFQAKWQPPTFETVCLVTARAFSNDGLFGQLSAAVLVRPGVQEPPAPFIYADLFHPNGHCTAFPGSQDVFCSPIAADAIPGVFVQVDWRGQAPGVLNVYDTCGGEFFDVFNDGFSFQANWRPSTTAPSCTIVTEAVTPEGLGSVVTMSFEIVGPPPPGEIQALVALQHPNGECLLDFGQDFVLCPAINASGVAFLHTEVRWGSAVPGEIFVSDDCDNLFSLLFRDPFMLQANWSAPPYVAASCTIQVTAVPGGGGDARAFLLSVPMF